LIGVAETVGMSSVSNIDLGPEAAIETTTIVAITEQISIPLNLMIACPTDYFSDFRILQE
jgi:hypothetical protein